MTVVNKPTVLITGAGSGIGRALAVEAAERGYHLILTGRRFEVLEETAEIAGAGDARLVKADITEAEGRAQIGAEVAKGPLNILINNAGVLNCGRLADISDESLSAMASTNLVAPIAMVREMLPHLTASKGRIVNFGSVFGDIAYPFFTAYSATKFGLRGFSDGLRRELSGTGVGVTYLAPRGTRTKAASEFDALIEPMNMPMDDPKAVALHAWTAIERGKSECLPATMERVFVRIQRLFPSIIDKSIGSLSSNPKVLAALSKLKTA